MVTPIRDILRRTARVWGLEPAAHLVLARQMWPQVVGLDLAKISAPVTLRGKTLVVGTTHPVAGQEIRLRQAGILAVLAREVGEGVVTAVFVVARRRLPGRGRGGPAAGGRKQTRGRRTSSVATHPASRRGK